MEKLQAVTAADVQRVAARVLVKGKGALALVGPDIDDAAFAEILAA